MVMLMGVAFKLQSPPTTGSRHASYAYVDTFWLDTAGVAATTHDEKATTYEARRIGAKLVKFAVERVPAATA